MLVFSSRTRKGESTKVDAIITTAGNEPYGAGSTGGS